MPIPATTVEEIHDDYGACGSFPDCDSDEGYELEDVESMPSNNSGLGTGEDKASPQHPWVAGERAHFCDSKGGTPFQTIILCLSQIGILLGMLMEMYAPGDEKIRNEITMGVHNLVQSNYTLFRDESRSFAQEKEALRRRLKGVRENWTHEAERHQEYLRALASAKLYAEAERDEAWCQYKELEEKFERMKSEIGRRAKQREGLVPRIEEPRVELPRTQRYSSPAQSSRPEDIAGPSMMSSGLRAPLQSVHPNRISSKANLATQGHHPGIQPLPPQLDTIANTSPMITYSRSDLLHFGNLLIKWVKAMCIIRQESVDPLVEFFWMFLEANPSHELVEQFYEMINKLMAPTDELIRAIQTQFPQCRFYTMADSRFEAVYSRWEMSPNRHDDKGKGKEPESRFQDSEFWSEYWHEILDLTIKIQSFEQMNRDQDQTIRKLEEALRATAADRDLAITRHKETLSSNDILKAQRDYARKEVQEKAEFRQIEINRLSKQREDFRQAATRAREKICKYEGKMAELMAHREHYHAREKWVRDAFKAYKANVENKVDKALKICVKTDEFERESLGVASVESLIGRI